MSYYHARMLDCSFADAITRTTAALGLQGFGILTDIDVAATLKKKLGKEMRAYRILGACNPKMADHALALENKIGTMLPCNVILREVGPSQTEVAAINPISSMGAIGNPELMEVAESVAKMLSDAVDTA